ncbi:MAG: HAMP domain-containing protein [Nitrosomonadales bacterium]|nr:HAMP domain-containing protein [Nitrosomonadales bacterium]
MGRLFWKFFFIFWLAQVFTSFGVGLAVWALRPEMPQAFVLPMPGDQPGRPPFPPPESRENIPSPPGTQSGMPPLAPPTGMGIPRPPPRPQGFMPPLLPVFAGSLASLIFAALLAWYFARPIRTLRTAFDSVANGKFDTRIGLSMSGRRDELADLGQDFDRMASRLQGLMDAQRRLLHDISHELRSPLARLQAATDLMQQQPDRAAEFIPRLERDTGRIDALVGELLTLARLDSGMAGRMDEPVDVSEILEHIASDARFEAASRQCSVDVNVPEHIPVKGNQELLFRALENVVRNAVLHTPGGKRVALAAKYDAFGKEWRITVLDEGSGVPPSELETIFQPFFRSKAHSSYAGYGLGLAITQRVVQAHGGTVTAANRPEGGLAVTITLPAGE